MVECVVLWNTDIAGSDTPVCMEKPQWLHKEVSVVVVA